MPAGEASVRPKLAGMTATGKKGKQNPSAKRSSKAEEKDAKRRQKALEKQVSRAEKEQAEQGRLSNSSLTAPVISRPLMPNDAVPQAWSPEGAGELSPLLALQGSKEKYGDPFSCIATASWQQAPNSSHYAPEATFTPTVVGLRPSEILEPALPESIKLIISQAISQGIAAGLQQRGQSASLASEPPICSNQQTQLLADLAVLKE